MDSDEPDLFDDLEPARVPGALVRGPVVGPCYIYALLDPRDGRVRYVGKTNGKLENRLSAHISAAKKPAKGHALCHRHRWIRQLLSFRLRPDIKQITCVEGDGCAEERRWIAHYRERGADLVNTTDGGEGVSGWVPDEGYRQRMSDATMGKKKPPGARCGGLGTPKTQAHRDNIAAAQRASWARRKNT